MGLVLAEIESVSGDDLALNRRGYILEDKIRHCTVRAIRDSGATMLEIPIHISKQLDLPKIRQIEAELADGSVGFYDVVRPVEVRFSNRQTSVEALVIPGTTKTLLGAIPMEGMDVLIDPQCKRLLVNPDSPNVAKMMLM